MLLQMWKLSYVINLHVMMAAHAMPLTYPSILYQVPSN